MHFYETSDLGLAAALCCLGHRIDHLDRSNPRRAVFHFIEEKEIDAAAQSYWDGTLFVSAIELFNHQKLLKQRLYGSHD